MAVINQKIKKDYAIYNADCMEVMPNLPDKSVGFSIYSPPFPELYQYSNDPRDMSNSVTYEEGLEHYFHTIKQIERITMDGRETAVHCMDLKRGQHYQRDFPGDIIRLHEAAGWNYLCRITIWKDPWLIARRTRMRALMHKTLVNDSSLSRVAGADYVLIFRKSGENKQPVRHEYGLKEYAGEMPIPEDLLQEFKNFKGDQKVNRLSHWIWRRYASPVWTDIRSGSLLPYKESKENEEEKHVCPLQMDIIERCLVLYSNKNDIVFTPFMGVGSEICVALKMERRALGIELKTTYYNQAAKNIGNTLEQNSIDQQKLPGME